MPPTKEPKEPSKQRRHVTTACDPCRESKVKCDGRTPTCTYCQNKGKICHYQVGADKRKLSFRFAIELLIKRTGQLSQFIVDQGLLIPPTLPEDDQTLRNVLGSVGLGHLKTIPEHLEDKVANLSTPQDVQFDPDSVLPNDSYLPPASNGVDLGSLQASDLGVDEHMQVEVSPSFPYDSHEFYLPTLGEELAGLQCPLEADAVESLGMGIFPERLWDLSSDSGMQTLQADWPFMPTQTVPLNQPSFSSPQQGDDQDENRTGDVEEIEELVNQISDRMGSLQVGSDGQVRFYGPTSHFNLLQMPAPDNSTIHRTVQKDGQGLLCCLGIDKDIPPEFEEHLINLFFTWHNPLFYVVDREIYYQERRKWRVDREESPYYSEALTNAMCCLGAAFVPRYHPDFITYPKSVSDFFADRAKALIDIELDLPCVATVQAMVVLSGHDIGCKRDARGWLYSGMAMRLSFDLGLHIDVAPYVAEGTITADEAELRRIVFWGTYSTDHLWGFFRGRPFRFNMEDVTVEKPGQHMIRETVTKWIAYGLQESRATATPLVDHQQMLSQYRAQLCEIMAPLGHALYGWSKLSTSHLQKLSRISTDKLLSWKSKLSPSLRVNVDDIHTVYLPHVLLLHMQYYQAIIHVHRPLMSKDYAQPQSPLDDGYYIVARNLCIDSAVAISKLLMLYEKEYTFRQMGIQAVSITCSAALMLIFATVASSFEDNSQFEDDNGDFITHLSRCFRALEEFSLSWENAKRAQTFLTNLQRRWEARANGFRTAKRVATQPHNRSQSQAPGPKRARLSVSEGFTSRSTMYMPNTIRI